MTEAVRLLSLLTDAAREQGDERYDHLRAMTFVNTKGPWNGITNLLAFHAINRSTPNGYHHLMDWVEWYEPVGTEAADVFQSAIKEIEK